MYGHIRNKGVNIAYESFGDESAEIIILVAGLGSQMISWSDAFCQNVVSRGYRVIRFDHRDVGCSSHFYDSPVPNMGEVNKAISANRQPDVPYTLDDMAGDLIGMMDALSITAAHFVGRSMGGMIAQIIAAHHPERVLSLSIIMSSSGNPSLPQTTSDVMALMTQPAPNPFLNEPEYLNHRLRLAERLAGKIYPFDTERYRSQFKEELRRCFNPEGFTRQMAALVASGDRRKLLATIAAPTLVVHGTDDPLFVPSHGEDVAINIPEAEFMLIDGMGHDIPNQLNALVTDAIVRIAQRHHQNSALRTS
ncbi:alpha/beta fold hydrolase [Pectobacterium atrosepticum]|uniref:alpha/beta fold hydrolase n=1 Tax=Pectobacterium atrosepticum TaxID=29471 RepID=UPI00049A2067|nr:alpha/beta hydrolase [Pectobacterium atrosepticum]AIA71044.1 alpha/beta hydrolase [Pectobacterium atrosepticum]AIK14130.1 putative hydrolase [Pectobacterium atrosepticum]POW29091.1 alpha/beta hydrolase [Pectobacterium atrosepticum]